MPSFVVTQNMAAKAPVSERMQRVTSTATTAQQVIVDGGAVDDVDLALAPSSVATIIDLVEVHKSGTANGGRVELESTWVRNGTGAPAQIGSQAAAYTLSGTSLDGMTIAHVANGNRIELRVTQETAEALEYAVRRTQHEVVD
jgi:hypothetical protein